MIHTLTVLFFNIYNDSCSVEWIYPQLFFFFLCVCVVNCLKGVVLSFHRMSFANRRVWLLVTASCQWPVDLWPEKKTADSLTTSILHSVSNFHLVWFCLEPLLTLLASPLRCQRWTVYYTAARRSTGVRDQLFLLQQLFSEAIYYTCGTWSPNSSWLVLLFLLVE